MRTKEREMLQKLRPRAASLWAILRLGTVAASLLAVACRATSPCER